MDACAHKLLQLIRACIRIGARKPSDLRHIFGMAHFAATQIEEPSADVRSFVLAEWQDIFPKSFPFRFQSFPGVGASISIVESAALVALMHMVQAKKVFEFGTYKGVSATQMAMNLPPDGLIYTLDLPDMSAPQVVLQISKESERTIAREPGKGSLIPKEFLSKIVFLREDSAKFDPAPFERKIDLVFVDGAHSADYVRNDTEKGWQMLRTGGVMAWHDCTPSHREVVAFLQAFVPKVTLVAASTLAFAIKPEP